LTNVLVDADIIAYRAAFSAKDEPEKQARQKVDDICSGIMYDCFYPINYTLGQNAWFYLTGSGNFRKDLATIKVYKGQRPPKPEHLPATRDQLVQQWGAEIVEGQEADDAIGIKATDLKGDCTIVSIDKDLLMIPGTHYNFVKKEWTEVSQEKGDYFFYKQLLTGDQVDNIQGVTGIGPKKAEKAYEGCTTVQEMYAKALEMYKGDADALLENARLLWLRRYEGEMWEPPIE
jgi:5'-3' exonuclease